MTNQQLKAHCEDVIANPQDHMDWVVDMARVALASLEAEPVVWIKPNSLGFPRMVEIDAVTIPYVPEYLVELYTAPPALKPIVLPPEWPHDDGEALLSKNRVIESIRAAGYEVKS